MVGVLVVWLDRWLIGCLAGRTLPGNDGASEGTRKPVFLNPAFLLSVPSLNLALTLLCYLVFVYTQKYILSCGKGGTVSYLGC